VVLRAEVLRERAVFLRPAVLRAVVFFRPAVFLRPVVFLRPEDFLRPVDFLVPAFFLRDEDLRADDLRTARFFAPPTLRAERAVAPARFFRLTAMLCGVTFLWRKSQVLALVIQHSSASDKFLRFERLQRTGLRR